MIVFVGTRPGPESLETGHYYSGRSNSFYKHLKQSGFTDILLLPRQDAKLLDYGIGLDDVYSNRESLKQRLESQSPISVCFNSKEALAWFAGMTPRELGDSWRGAAAKNHVLLAGTKLVWALPDSSGTARRYHEDRLQLLRELKALLSVICG